MAFTYIDCPRCGARKVTAKVAVNASPDQTLWDCFATCHGCRRGFCITIQAKFAHPNGPALQDGLINNEIWPIVSIAPEPPSNNAPQHTPSRVADVFSQALKSLHERSWDAAGAMARKTIDLATFNIDRELKQRATLADRIDALEEKRLITPQLKDWAHIVRLDGNDATHDEEIFSESDAKQICRFTELFLQYVFTMPEELKIAQITQ